MGLAGPFERAAFPLRDQGILRGAPDLRGGGGGGIPNFLKRRMGR